MSDLNYYYDIFLNFQDKYWQFYEWDASDSLDFVKKIPLFHINAKALIDIMTSVVKFDEKFLESIQNKTKLAKNGTLEYACILGDGKNSLAIELNKDGVIISKSSLNLDDELSINEFMYNIPKMDISYEIINKEERVNCLRQELKIKNILKCEITNLMKNKNYSKLKYLYLEWFNKLNDDYINMGKEMLDKIKGNLTEEEYKIYKIIQISYNNV